MSKKGHRERIDIEGKHAWRASESHMDTVWTPQLLRALSLFLQQHLLQEHGVIIEYGSFKGKTLEFLKKTLPNRQILGFDSYNFIGNSDIIELDIRNICSYPEYRLPIAFAINELPNWETSPITRQAGYDHAMSNLLVGGFYLESRNLVFDYPKHLYENPYLERIFSIYNFVGFKKIK